MCNSIGARDVTLDRVRAAVIVQEAGSRAGRDHGVATTACGRGRATFLTAPHICPSTMIG
jgi:hypothetical protein